ncbi:30S ribosomal protein S17 [Geoalkalibacter halelectricus]|uniref:Small ribosomal subunit protein uS17 n=1 Tax=Geoalkalibacter halelectricus TaxID=2847045 RepID=A0ABY5ZJR9_9BACT|nr:30S ribosomal protein S17 [Geoalkalibacter halelectricus]MDO3379084.1 30S ribosomal protein S17 [Geoalkalibacter halelectricus]UWZ78971.1 30S ribosomal protein S17 [Geoalkalibacter halelectricus]
MTKQRGNRKTRIGVVVSDKMDKTVVVRVDQVVKHPVYQKYIKRKVTCKAHDENNSCQVGDKVLIVESRPLSRDKFWTVRQILAKTTNV